MLKIYGFSIDHVTEPEFIKCSGLRFAWKLLSDRKNVLQKGYRIHISDDKETVFDSGFVESECFYDISFDELALRSRTDYTVRLTVTDNYGQTASFSCDTSTEILPEEWEAEWIKPAEHISGWAPYLRTKFDVSGVKKAVMYACGLGCAEYYVNGIKTDDALIDPPSSNYDKTVYYRRYDVTDMLKDGGNAVAVLLGEGFYSQSRVWAHDNVIYGDVCLILRLEITLQDGSQKVITTNSEDWEYKYSPITVNNLYGGETYDCRLETPDFCDYNGSQKGWERVITDTAHKGVLTPCFIPPVKVIRELETVEMHCASGKDDGAWIFDIGENIAGFAEFTLPCSPRGAVYVFRFAENVDATGQLDFRSTGAFATQCIQQDIYICRGDQNGEVYRPRFTYHGFRYVEVTGFHDFSNGYGTLPKLSLVKGIQIATAFEDNSDFVCSCNDLNRLYRAMKNTYVSNYHGHPEDCPAREKCGWLGDAQIVCDWGLLNYDTAACYVKYLNDIRTTCEHFGTWKQISPGLRDCGEASPLWGCAQIFIPYFLYKYTGDTKAITDNFDLMELWMKHELDRSKDHIITEGLGDWIPPCKNESPRRMPVEHSSTAVFYEQCILMEKLCKTLNLGDASYYEKLGAAIKESFNRSFYNTDAHSYGYWGTDAVALMTDMYPDGERELLLDALVEMIKKDDYFMSTAIYGNKYLIPLLLREGRGDIALKCLFTREHPSFGTMLDDGATTLYEALYDVMYQNRKISHSSFNHPMQGGFLYTLTTELCGLNCEKEGFGKVRFSPCFAEGIESIKACYELNSGRFEVEIKNKADQKHCRLTIPAGVTAVIDISGEISINGDMYVQNTVIGSGEYDITVR